MARAPAQPAPIAIPRAASSSSACTMAKVAFCGLRVDSILLHVIDHLLDQRTRRSDRIPGDDRASAEHGAQPGGGVALNNDFALSLVHPLNPKRVGLHQIRAGVVDADLHRLDIGVSGLDLGLELLSNRLFHFDHVDSEQFRHDPYVDHVGQQFSQLDLGHHLPGQLGEGNAIVADVARARPSGPGSPPPEGPRPPARSWHLPAPSGDSSRP